MLTRVLFAFALICGTVATSWAEETKVLALGITDHAVTQEELESGAALPAPHFNTPGVAYVLAANVKKGDIVEVALMNGNKPLLHNTRDLEADEAIVLLQAGKTGVPAGGWPEGAYAASVKIMRDGKPLIEKKTEPIVFE